jgi:hypothetical protein
LVDALRLVERELRDLEIDVIQGRCVEQQLHDLRVYVVLERRGVRMDKSQLLMFR